MADLYRVKAPVVKVSIGSLDGNRVARILRAGAIVPEGVATESLEQLTKRGFIEKLEVTAVAIPDEEPVQDASTSDQGAPQGTEDEEQGDGNEQPPTPPAQGGPGSGAEAWRNYAAKVGVDVPQDASRDDVITALEAAGKPTE